MTELPGSKASRQSPRVFGVLRVAATRACAVLLGCALALYMRSYYPGDCIRTDGKWYNTIVCSDRGVLYVIVDAHGVEQLSTYSEWIRPARRAGAPNYDWYSYSRPPGTWHVAGFAVARGTTSHGPHGPNEYDPPVPYWRLRVPYWPLLVLLSIGPGFWVRRRWVVGCRQRRGLCVVCGYDLRATPARCPECGTPVPVCSASPSRPDAARTQRDDQRDSERGHARH